MATPALREILVSQGIAMELPPLTAMTITPAPRNPAIQRQDVNMTLSKMALPATIIMSVPWEMSANQVSVPVRILATAMTSLLARQIPAPL